MSCQYCYLGDLTETQPDTTTILGTLHTALEQLLLHGYLPFNLSFHGGEVTTLSSEVLDSLFHTAAKHYSQYGSQIHAQGFRVNPPHIKTNLLTFQKHWDVLVKHQVSISGSVDLPLRLHERFRRDKGGNSTLQRTLENLQALAAYPYNKKISCVVTRAHLEAVDEFIDAIKYLHYDIGLDMSRFNVMFGFHSHKNNDKFHNQVPGTEMLTQLEQVDFYHALKQAFLRTPLENAFKNEWFKEFTPDFCCSSVNCGDKFFLLQSDGSVFSCPRGQSSKQYCYGNIYEEDIETIMHNGENTIERNENLLFIADTCMICEYLHLCNLGCTFVRQETNLQKSYTCLLQRELYHDNPDRYPSMAAAEIENYARHFLLRNNLQKLHKVHTQKQRFLTPELNEKENWLSEIIQRDTVLQDIYGDGLFLLNVNDVNYRLRSAILKNEADIEVLDSNSQVILGVRNDIFSLACNDEINNYLHLMLLRDTTVKYGDEQRTKQEHIFDYSVYRNIFLSASEEVDGYFLFDISQILINHSYWYLDGIKNNLFFTTKALREYHYTKQKKNAFYHIQAINLPFHNIEFFWNRNTSV